MADHVQSPRPGLGQQRRNSPTKQALNPISCTHCRQRKIKCDKVQPCAPCQRSGLDCVFPERARHPKKNKTASKATNDELLARLSRMEQLIGQMEGGGKPGAEDRRKSSQSPEIGDTVPLRHTSLDRRVSGDSAHGSTGDGLNRFIASGFWRSLTNEVGLPQEPCYARRSHLLKYCGV